MSPEATPAERRSGMGGMWEAQKSVAGGEHGGFGRAAGGEGEGQVLLLLLPLAQGDVDSAVREELLMRALLATAAFLKHQGPVRVLNGAQAGRHEQSGAPG